MSEEVAVTHGRLRGRVAEDTGIRSFLGVPYAKAPLAVLSDMHAFPLRVLPGKS